VVLPDQDGALPFRTVPPLDEEPAHTAVLVVPVPDSDSGAPLQGVSRVEGPTEDPVGGGAGETGKLRGRWKIRDLLADGRCSQAVLDFLSATDMGRRVPAEEDTVSEVSEAELRDREEE